MNPNSMNTTIPTREGGLELLSNIARQASTASCGHKDNLADAGPQDNRLQRFFEQHGANNDLLVQCGATQQVLQLCPRQMYEVLTSRMHASQIQQMFATVQTRSQSSTSGFFNTNPLTAGETQSGVDVKQLVDLDTDGSVMTQGGLMQQQGNLHHSGRRSPPIFTGFRSPSNPSPDPQVQHVDGSSTRHQLPPPYAQGMQMSSESKHHDRGQQHQIATQPGLIVPADRVGQQHQQCVQEAQRMQEEQQLLHNQKLLLHHQKLQLQLQQIHQLQHEIQQSPSLSQGHSLSQGQRPQSQLEQSQEGEGQVQVESTHSADVRGTKRPAADALSAVEKSEQCGTVPDDGFRWRKHGEKMCATPSGQVVTKSYYRCGTDSCPMRKQVEKGSDGMRVHIVGDGHNHAPPGLKWSQFRPNPPQEIGSPTLDLAPNNTNESIEEAPGEN